MGLTGITKLLNINTKAMSLEDHMGKLEKEKKTRK